MMWFAFWDVASSREARNMRLVFDILPFTIAAMRGTGRETGNFSCRGYARERGGIT